MRRTLLAAALLLAAHSGAARAQQNLYRFELTPTASYNWGGSLDASDSELFAADLEVEDDAAFGVTFDIPLSSNIQLELLASRQSSRLTVGDGLFAGSAELADIDVTYYHAGILWQWGDRRVSPFFTMSAGIATLDPDFAGASPEERFSVSLGGGVKVFVAEHIGFRFEGRGFFTDLGGSDDWNDYYDCHGYDDDCNGNEFAQGQASAGLILAW